MRSLKDQALNAGILAKSAQKLTAKLVELEEKLADPAFSLMSQSSCKGIPPVASTSPCLSPWGTPASQALLEETHLALAFWSREMVPSQLASAGHAQAIWPCRFQSLVSAHETTSTSQVHPEPRRDHLAPVLVTSSKSLVTSDLSLSFPHPGSVSSGRIP